ncbi:MAG: NB-ARC domain-containing protein [Pseudomonadota bacterium]
MTSFAEQLTAAMEYAKISNDRLARKLRLSPVTISRWKNGTVINGKLQLPSQREYLLAGIKPLRLPQQENGFQACNRLFQAAGHAVLDFEEQKKYFPESIAEPSPPRQHWGEMPEVSIFYGRSKELETLQRWIVTEQCRLIAICGMGGIGKTALAAKISQQINGHFQYIIWLSLREAPPLSKCLTELHKFLSPKPDINLPNSLGDSITRLIEYLRYSPCLVVLDNAEAILRGGTHSGQYRTGYQDYGQLIKRVAESQHLSCLLLTSREKPVEIVLLEGEKSPIRSLQISGLNSLEGQKFFTQVVCDSDLKKIIEHYAGNPLALKIVQANIRDWFSEDISKLIANLEQGEFIFDDLSKLLQEQFERLSESEREVMYWLAINREGVSISQLAADVVSPSMKREIPNAVNSLRRRSLIEKAAGGFTLQNVVMEYTTEQFITQIVAEILSTELLLFNRHALLKASSKDYVRETQARLILKPVMDRLIASLGLDSVKNQLKQILISLQKDSQQKPGYTGGNILNLLCLQETQLSDYDWSYLSIWQAYLVEVNLRGVNLAHADLAHSSFAQTFGRIFCLKFSPDGQLLATTDSQGQIRLWQMPEFKNLMTCQGPDEWILSVVFSLDGKILASCSNNNTIRLWNVHDGQCFKTLQGHTNTVYSIALRGKTLASCSRDQTVKLWNIDDGLCFKTLLVQNGPIYSIALSPDGKTLACGDDDYNLNLWDIHQGQCLKSLQGHSNLVGPIVFSPDGQFIASGSYDQTVRIWNVHNGQCLHTLQGQTPWLWSMAFSPNSKMLASVGDDLCVRLWDIHDGDCLNILQGHRAMVHSVDFSPNGENLVSGSEDKSIKIWNVRNGKCLKTLRGYSNQVWSIAISPDGQTLASTYDDHCIRLWNLPERKCYQTLQAHKDIVRSVAFSPDGQILASGSCDETVKLFKVHNGQSIKILKHNCWIPSVTFSCDNQTIATAHTINR